MSIDSLDAYILVESSNAAVVVHRRDGSGFQRETYLALDAVIPLPEIECELRLADLYEDVEFRPAVAEDESEYA